MNRIQLESDDDDEEEEDGNTDSDGGMQLSISAYYGLFHIILMARNCFPLCFCVLCLVEERNEIFFCFSPPPPPPRTCVVSPPHI